MIEAEGLTKRYGQTVALAGIDLQVPAGSILGVLGPNGAGKTTAVRILTTLSRPDSGWARVADHDVVEPDRAERRPTKQHRRRHQAVGPDQLHETLALDRLGR